MRAAKIGAAVIGGGFGAALLLLAALGGAPTGTGVGGAVKAGTVPAAYSRDVDRYGALCPQLSPSLLAAQIQQESGFHPGAISAAGAVGIGQFLPSTFATWGISATGGVPDINNPQDGIASMANYDCGLAHELANVPGDPVDNMLAGYNAGPYAVIHAGGIPPFLETRNYVRTIRAAQTGFAAGPTAGAPGGPLGQSVPAAAGTGTDPIAGASVRARGALTFAYRMLGTPYLWGGNGDATSAGRFDCSGLTQTAFAAAGIHIPRGAIAQYPTGPHPTAGQLQPGDLLFYAFDTADPSTIHHVGIYAGGRQMIDAPHTGAQVRYDPINQPGYLGATRPTAR